MSKGKGELVHIGKWLLPCPYYSITLSRDSAKHPTESVAVLNAQSGRNIQRLAQDLSIAQHIIRVSSS